MPGVGPQARPSFISGYSKPYVSGLDSRNQTVVCRWQGCNSFYKRNNRRNHEKRACKVVTGLDRQLKPFVRQPHPGQCASQNDHPDPPSGLDDGLAAHTANGVDAGRGNGPDNSPRAIPGTGLAEGADTEAK